MKRKKKFPIWAILLIIVLIIVLLMGGVYAYVNHKLSKIMRVDISPEVVVDPSLETFETEEGLTDTIDPEDIVWNNADIEVMKDKDVSNILLIGQDRREGQGRQRSDSMIICSLNKKTNKIILTSVMRDMYVPIPGYSDNRINAAYQFGGMELLDRVLEESLGVHIDANVEVDFEGFINCMAEVGNIDMQLNEEEAKYLNDANGWNLQAGYNSLTPEQALAFSRVRYVGHSDWERTDRQRRVIISAFNNVKGLSIPELISLTDRIFPNVTTDMTNSKILGYVYTVVTNKMTTIDSNRLPAEGTYTCETLRKGMEVLVPDLKANAECLKEYIYKE
ncbi:LCP family protein [bacterium]|nr:LCP family protein [bacterium]MDY3023188.1 LCP family protein [Oliverpabstia sp.]